MTRVFGITDAAAHIPARRITRETIAAAHAWVAPNASRQARGMRSFANWDEDAITMAVEAVRPLARGNRHSKVKSVFLASTTLPFADRHNAGVLMTALRLPQDALSLDVTGSQRAGTSALRQALIAGVDHTIVVASDRRRAKPGSSAEMSWGDAAAAVALGSEGVVAESLGHVSFNTDFVDHFRESHSDYDYFWEERWVRDEGYRKHLPPAIKQAIGTAGVDPSSIRHAIIPSPDAKTSQEIAKACGISAEALSDSLAANVGITGVAHSLLMLIDVLTRAQPGDIILVASFGQGVDALLFRATEAVTAHRPTPLPLKGTLTETSYLKFLSFNADIPFEWGMRAELDQKTALTAQYRNAEMVTAFMAGRCSETGVVQFPRTRISVEPGHHAVDKFEDYPLADEPARVLSFAADWLSYAPSPPYMYGQVQFDVGARLIMEFVDAPELSVGTPLRMVFRIKDVDSKRGYRRYFWKAAPK